MVEESTYQFTSSVQALDRPPRPVDYPSIGVNAHTTEREGDAAGDHETEERWGVNRLRPVRLGWLDPLSSLAIFDRRVEIPRLDRSVELFYRSV